MAKVGQWFIKNVRDVFFRATQLSASEDEYAPTEVSTQSKQQKEFVDEEIDSEGRKAPLREKVIRSDYQKVKAQMKYLLAIDIEFQKMTCSKDKGEEEIGIVRRINEEV